MERKPFDDWFSRDPLDEDELFWQVRGKEASRPGTGWQEAVAVAVADEARDRGDA